MESGQIRPNPVSYFFSRFRLVAVSSLRQQSAHMAPLVDAPKAAIEDFFKTMRGEKTLRENPPTRSLGQHMPHSVVHTVGMYPPPRIGSTPCDVYGTGCVVCGARLPPARAVLPGGNGRCAHPLA